jgi:hypothetical protein
MVAAPSITDRQSGMMDEGRWLTDEDSPADQLIN